MIRWLSSTVTRFHLTQAPQYPDYVLSALDGTDFVLDTLGRGKNGGNEKTFPEKCLPFLYSIDYSADRHQGPNPSRSALYTQ